MRTRRRKAQQYRAKHIVALARRPSLRRIVMAPGASAAHAMMEDKEKTLHGTLAAGESFNLKVNVSATHTHTKQLFSLEVDAKRAATELR